MKETEVCPRCSAEFSSRKALLAGGLRSHYNVYSPYGPAVRCPNCWHIFPAEALRLFGFLPATRLPWVIAGIIVLCVVLPVLLR
ncbi:MAG: hypothetical protein REI94_14895 [Moraxellaceae bacterium]|nr:hypothetical protein [Moraxellaceae bacterium]